MVDKKVFLLTALTLFVISADSVQQTTVLNSTDKGASWLVTDPVLRQMAIRDEIDHGGELSEEMEDQIIREKPICISLGVACTPVYQIIKNDLRGVAYPFDWNMCSHASLISLIKNDFAQFLEQKHIIFSGHTNITNNLYAGFRLTHVCPVTAAASNFFKNYWSLVHDRMQRRIRRFYKALNSGKPVYFLRVSVSPDHARQDPTRLKPITQAEVGELVELIKNKFPQLNFTVIAVGCDPSFKGDWNMPQVKNFYQSEEVSTWQGDYDLFKKIFTQLGLLPR